MNQLNVTQINPYLSFNGKTREAMAFYKECFGGELTLMPVDGSPVADKMPPEMKDKILHSMLVSGHIIIMGSDCSCGGDYVHGNAVTLSINCTSDEEIQRFFKALSAGGEVTTPLGEQFWGATFGTLTDKFGFSWMLNCEKKKA
jgi:PhnB protein